MINTKKIISKCLGRNATEGIFRPISGPESQEEAIVIGRIRAYVVQRAGGPEKYSRLSESEKEKLSLEGLQKYGKNIMRR